MAAHAYAASIWYVEWLGHKTVMLQVNQVVLALCLQVTREERRLARDKAVYQRIKQAYAASGGASAGRKAVLAAAGGSNAWSATVEVGPGTGGAAGRCSNAAGAVAAAARELRPVELVGIYEGQKEALEKELAAARAEVSYVAACAVYRCTPVQQARLTQVVAAWLAFATLRV